MSLTTSFFNKTLFKCDLKRYWWISAINAIIFFLSTTIPMYDRINYLTNPSFGWVERDITQRFTSFFESNAFSISVVMAVGTAIVLAAFLFSYMNKTNACSCIHGLPVTRTQLYFTHLISAFVLFALPYVINCLLWISPLLTARVSLLLIVKAFYLYIIYGVVVLSLVTAIGMLTGSSVAQVVFSGIVALMPAFFTAYILYACSLNLYGFSESGAAFDFLLKYIYISPEQLFSSRGLVYVAMTIVFVIAGLLLYKMRGLESGGEIIAFPSLKGIFKVLVALCAGMLGHLYMAGLWDMRSMLFMIPFSIIGLIIAHMLAQKSFSLKGIVPALIAAVVVDLAVFATFEFDLTGFETRVPNENKVLSVELDGTHGNYREYFYSSDDGKQYQIADVYKPIYDDPEEIAAFTALHKHLVDTKNVVDSDEGKRIYYYRYNTVNFTYTLKNGNQMSRYYTLSYDDVTDYMSKIYETDTYRAFQFPVLDGTYKIYRNVTVDDVRKTGKNDFVFEAGDKELDMIIQALIKDRQNISFEEMNGRKYGNSLISIHVNYDKQGMDEYGNLIDKYCEFSDRYNITDGDVYTMAVLDEIGFFDDSSIHTSAEGLRNINVSVGDVYTKGSYVAYGHIPEHVYEEYNELMQGIVEDGSEQTYTTKNNAETAIAVAYDKYNEEKSYKSADKMEHLFGLAFYQTHDGEPYYDGSYVYLNMYFEYDDGGFHYGFWCRLEEVPEFIMNDFAENQK